MEAEPALIPRIAVCLHGFLRTGAAMLPIAYRLKSAGYTEVICPTFQLALGPIERHGERAAKLIAELSERNDGMLVDVVTHSMGGLVFRASLAHSPPIRRVVMLAPPNKGAQAADKVRSWLPLHFSGWDPLAPLLSSSPDSLPTPPDNVEFGILTGGVGSEAGYSSMLTGDNDGKVRVEEARLEGARDFRVVPYHHTLIMAWDDVFRLVLCFFRHGTFENPFPALPGETTEE
jgi:pimeloyl-ACP methyl ester carboxylesterase